MSTPGPSRRDRVERMLLWRVWERLLEIEFLDRSIALAGKAFVSFFPLVIVVAAFVPERVRESILTTLTRRMGISGDALATTREAFASSDDIREATGCSA
jgi:membrane protein